MRCRRHAVVTAAAAFSQCAFGWSIGANSCTRQYSLAAHSHSRRTFASRVILHSADEEVESFDFDYDTNRLDIMNAYLTDVKQNGFVQVSTNIVYDCTHGIFLLMQMAYDRKIKLFSCKSTQELWHLSSMVPDDAKVIFTGTFQPKHCKRFLKLKNLQGVVVADAASVVELQTALDDERARLESKSLNKVSRSRSRFLSGPEGESGASRAQAPAAALIQSARVYLRLSEDSTAESTTALMTEIKEQCPQAEVLGLWGSSTAAYDLFVQVKAAVKSPKLTVAIPYTNIEESFKWNQRLGDGRGNIIWTCEFQ